MERAARRMARGIGRVITAALVAMSLAATARAADLVRVGEGPYITGGGFFVAQQKGYFEKLGITLETKSFIDGAVAVPSMIAGELDVTFMTAAASLFNSVAKGAPLVLFLDRGYNRAGRGYIVINVSQALYDQGVHGIADFAKLKGKKIGVGALGSVNQYDTSRALQMAGLDPRKDVQWIANIGQPDLAKMLGQNQLDATDLAYQIGLFAQNNKWGPIVGYMDQIVPDSQIAVYAVSKSFLASKRDVLVRFAMAYLAGARLFNAAATDPDHHPDIVEILAKTTALNKPELVKAIAPYWSYVSEDGVPQVDSIMAMQDYWSDYYAMVSTKVTREQLFDLSIARDAAARLEQEKPFGP